MNAITNSITGEGTGPKPLRKKRKQTRDCFHYADIQIQIICMLHVCMLCVCTCYMFVPVISTCYLFVHVMCLYMLCLYIYVCTCHALMLYVYMLCVCTCYMFEHVIYLHIHVFLLTLINCFLTLRKCHHS